MESCSYSLYHHAEISRSFEHYLAIGSERAIQVIDVERIDDRMDTRREPVVFDTGTISVRCSAERAWCRLECMVLQEKHLWAALVDGSIRVWDWRHNKKLTSVRREHAVLPLKMWADDQQRVFVGTYNEKTQISAVKVYTIAHDTVILLTSTDGTVRDHYMMAGLYTLAYSRDHLSIWQTDQQCFELQLSRLMVQAATIYKVDDDVFVYKALSYNTPTRTTLITAFRVNRKPEGSVNRALTDTRVFDMTVYRDTLALFVHDMQRKCSGVVLLCRRSLKKLDFIPLQCFWVDFHLRFTVINRGGTHESLVAFAGRNFAQVIKPRWTRNLAALQMFVIAQNRRPRRLPLEIMQLVASFM